MVSRLSGSRTALAVVMSAVFAIPMAPAAVIAADSRSDVRSSEQIDATADTAGIPVVSEIVQARPKGEDQAQAWSDALD